MRLIDADALMQSLGITNMDCDKCAWHDKEWSRCKRGGDFEDACCAIEDAPTIEERKRGQWIKEYWNGEHTRKCSACNITQTVTTYRGKVNFNYCPYCGVDMRGEDDEAD